MKTKTKFAILWNIVLAELYLLVASFIYVSSGKQLKVIIGIILLGIIVSILLALFMLGRKSKQPMDDLMEFVLEKKKNGGEKNEQGNANKDNASAGLSGDGDNTNSIS